MLSPAATFPQRSRCPEQTVLLEGGCESQVRHKGQLRATISQGTKAQWRTTFGRYGGTFSNNSKELLSCLCHSPLHLVDEKTQGNTTPDLPPDVAAAE